MPISEILDGVWAENTAVINHSSSVYNVHGAGAFAICVRDNNGDIPHLFLKTASNNLRHSHDAELNDTGIVLTKKKTFRFPRGIIGTLRIAFDIHGSNDHPAYGQIYKNGEPLGTLRTPVSNVYVTYTEDLTVSLINGDTIELWGCGDGVNGRAYWRNFRLYYDNAPDTIAVNGVTTS